MFVIYFVCAIVYINQTRDHAAALYKLRSAWYELTIYCNAFAAVNYPNKQLDLLMFC